MKIKNSICLEVYNLFVNGPEGKVPNDINQLMLRSIKNLIEVSNKHTLGSMTVFYIPETFKISLKSVVPSEVTVEDFENLYFGCFWAYLRGSYFKETWSFEMSPSDKMFFNEQRKLLGDAGVEISGEVNYRLLPELTERRLYKQRRPG